MPAGCAAGWAAGAAGAGKLATGAAAAPEEADGADDTSAAASLALSLATFGFSGHCAHCVRRPCMSGVLTWTNKCRPSAKSRGLRGVMKRGLHRARKRARSCAAYTMHVTAWSKTKRGSGMAFNLGAGLLEGVSVAQTGVGLLD